MECKRSECYLGKDSGKVVIDEVAEMAITLLLVTKNINLFINCFNCI